MLSRWHQAIPRTVDEYEMIGDMEKRAGCGWPGRPKAWPGPPAYNGAPGAYYACGPADYARLRINSDCDPFIGSPNAKEEGLNWNDPFADLDEELPWLETFADISTFENEQSFVLHTPIEAAVEKNAAEVDWEEWSRFLRENHPQDYQLGSGGSSPISNCDEYMPNFEVIDYGQQLEAIEPEAPMAQAQLPIEAFPEGYELPQELLEPEPKATRGRPRRGRPPAQKPKRPKARVNPIYDDDEDDDASPSDLRRRALNRDAAFRYRERKKAEKDAIFLEAQELEKRNSWLNARLSTLHSEISRMRSHLRDMGALE